MGNTRSVPRTPWMKLRESRVKPEFGSAIASSLASPMATISPKPKPKRDINASSRISV